MRHRQGTHLGPAQAAGTRWQITAQWKYDPGFLTEVEVSFTPEGPKRTRVDLEHRNLERYGVDALELRKGIDSPGGWGRTLENLAAVVAEESQVL